jgi:serine protease Do
MLGRSSIFSLSDFYDTHSQSSYSGSRIRNPVFTGYQSAAQRNAADCRQAHYSICGPDVVRSGPGANAGLRPGDILLELNGQALAGPEDLRRALARFAPGNLALLKAWREGRERIVSATLGEEPEARRAAHFPGFAVRPLTPEMGVVVAGVPRLGPAWLAGLRRGDILREINSRPIQSIEDFEAITERVKEGDRIVLLVQRADVALYVAFVAPTERSGRQTHE